MKVNTTSPVVSIGIDAAVVAAHQIAVRGEVREDFKTRPTLAGLAKLTERLEPYGGSLVVAEPTAGTWLPLAHAVTAAGCEIGFVANRDSARLRKAITGASKTDLIDADMLAHCAEVLGVTATEIPPPDRIALRRAIRRRNVCTVDAHRVECRLWALAAWAFPDLWQATGGHTVAQPLLNRWPDLERLGRARVTSIADIVAAHSRDTRPQRRAERIRDAAAGWATFWTGRLDLDGLTWELNEMLDDINTADRRHRPSVETVATTLARRRTHLNPRARTDMRLNDPRLVGQRHPPPLSQSSHRSRRAEPLDVVLRAQRSLIAAHHQTRTSRAPPRALPGRQRRPATRPPTRRSLPAAHG